MSVQMSGDCRVVSPPLLATVVAAVGLTFSGTALKGQVLSLTQRSVTALGAVSANDQNAQSFTVGSLSGIAFAGGNTFWAVMDNSNKLVQLNVNFGSNGSISSATVSGGLTLGLTRDNEGVAISANGLSAFISDETDPAVRAYRLSDGVYQGALPLPTVFINRRANFGLESLSRSGNTIWTANEEALTTDGALSDETNGTLVRLQQFDATTGSAGAAFAYRTAAIHKDAKDVPPREETDLSRSGLADLVALPDGRLLTLERSFARADFIFADAGSDYNVRIYATDITGASNVSSLAGLDGVAGIVPAAKSLLWSNTTGAIGGTIGNLEGLALGPQLANGNYVLLGVVDDGGGNDPLSGRNRLVSFELSGSIPEPSALLLTVSSGFLLLRRRPNRGGHQ